MCGCATLIEQPGSAARTLRDNARCGRRQVTIAKPDGPARIFEVAADGDDAPYCLDNDGAFRAIQLDDGDRPALGAGQRVRVQGRLIPRVADEADWFSIQLNDANGRQAIELELQPGPDMQGNLIDELAGADAAAFVADRRRCVGRYTRLVAYLACTRVRPANVGGCARDPLTQHLVCFDNDSICTESGETVRARFVRLPENPCVNDAGIPVAGEPLLFVGVLRLAEADDDAPCDSCDAPCGPCVNLDSGTCIDGQDYCHDAPPSRSVTYELTIDYR